MFSKGDHAREFQRRMAAHVPSFSDIFNEQSFYVFVIIFILITIVSACVASRYIKIRDAGHVD